MFATAACIMIPAFYLFFRMKVYKRHNINGIKRNNNKTGNYKTQSSENNKIENAAIPDFLDLQNQNEIEKQQSQISGPPPPNKNK